jgi:K+/H+ antiporter YhaU regulatory subunit KhtT
MRERHGVTVLAVVRADGERIDHPSADTVLRAGDTVKVFGLPVQVEAMLRDAAAP